MRTSAAYDRSAARGLASGKVILLGEHAVVHGQPAMAAAIDRSLRVTLVSAAAGAESNARDDPRPRQALERAARMLELPDLDAVFARIEGDLPMAVGLGSSAALSVALVRAVASRAGRTLDAVATAEHAHELEKLFHGKPSGVDATTVALGGVVWFEPGPPRRIEAVMPGAPLELIVVLSGERHATGTTVGELAERVRREPETYQSLFTEIGDLVRAGRAALVQGDLGRLGELMLHNHRLLRACGVSSNALDEVVKRAVELGAAGAKLTGAGGGGAAIVLPRGAPETLLEGLSGRGYEAFIVGIAPADLGASDG